MLRYFLFCFIFKENDEASTYLVFCLLMFIELYLLLFPLSLHLLPKCSLFFQTALIHLLCWDLCFQAYFSINSDVPRLCASFILSVFKWKWQNKCPCFIKYSLTYFYSVLRNSHIACFSGEKVPWWEHCLLLKESCQHCCSVPIVPCVPSECHFHFQQLLLHCAEQAVAERGSCQGTPSSSWMLETWWGYLLLTLSSVKWKVTTLHITLWPL